MAIPKLPAPVRKLRLYGRRRIGVQHNLFSSILLSYRHRLPGLMVNTSFYVALWSLFNFVPACRTGGMTVESITGQIFVLTCSSLR